MKQPWYYVPHCSSTTGPGSEAREQDVLLTSTGSRDPASGPVVHKVYPHFKHILPYEMLVKDPNLKLLTELQPPITHSSAK